MTDDHARFVLEDSGRHEGRLTSLVTELAELAATLKITRDELPLPELPAGLQLAAWYVLAGELESPVEAGDLSIRPQLRGLTVVVTPRASSTPGHAAGLFACITTPFPLDASRQQPSAAIQVRDHSITLQIRAIDEDGTALARQIRHLADLAHDLRLSASPYR